MTLNGHGSKRVENLFRLHCQCVSLFDVWQTSSSLCVCIFFILFFSFLSLSLTWLPLSDTGVYLRKLVANTFIREECCRSLTSSHVGSCPIVEMKLVQMVCPLFPFSVCWSDSGFMNCSASELACGHSGVIFGCLTPFSLMYALSSWLLNSGPLSLLEFHVLWKFNPIWA